MWAAHRLAVLCLSAALLAVAASELSAQRGPRGPRMRGADPSFRADMALFHFLLDHRNVIRRKVTQLENGIETVTESDDPKVAARIKEHVKSMYRRLEEGRPIHMRDPLFAEVFRNADKISMTLEETKKGVKVTETSSDPHAVRLIQAHAEVVNRFLKNGHLEMRRNHAVPGPGDRQSLDQEARAGGSDPSERGQEAGDAEQTVQTSRAACCSVQEESGKHRSPRRACCRRSARSTDEKPRASKASARASKNKAGENSLPECCRRAAPSGK